MTSMLSLLSSKRNEHPCSGGGKAASEPVVRVKTLSERDRRRLLTHCLSLGEADRMQRFGSAYSDDAITRYVQKIDLERDAVFGVFDGLQLVGVGHLAFVAREATPLPRTATSKVHVGELGISVLPQARGRGVGSKLLERAAMICRNQEIDTLFIHCLTDSEVVRHIANKVGMEVKHVEGETSAFLRLVAAEPRDVLKRTVRDRCSSFSR